MFRMKYTLRTQGSYPVLLFLDEGVFLCFKLVLKNNKIIGIKKNRHLKDIGFA